MPKRREFAKMAKKWYGCIFQASICCSTLRKSSTNSALAWLTLFGRLC